MSTSDYKGAALMLNALPRAKALLGDRGYDADWFRAALAEHKITACIPSKANRKAPIPRDTALCRQRHKIEIMFGRLKDWRRIHTRYGEAFTMLTMVPGPDIAPYHDRQIVILDRADWGAWLDPSVSSKSLIKELPAAALEVKQVA